MLMENCNILTFVGFEVFTAVVMRHIPEDDTLHPHLRSPACSLCKQAMKIDNENKKTL
jgi:hypothetical protein